MQALPHHYLVSAAAEAAGNVTVTCEGLAALDTNAPPEFGGPEGLWSPETLFAAAIADCYILSFRACSGAAKLEWIDLKSEVVAVLDRVERQLKFTEVEIRATLRVPAGTDLEKARQVAEKAESTCLITNSLTAECRLELTLETLD